MGSVVNVARRLAKNRLLAHLTADVVLFGNFTKAVLKIPKDNFLMVGRRWDLKVNGEIDFNDDWEKKLQERLKKEGKLHGLSGMDYFVFPKDALGEFPPFIIGSPASDNWVVYKARAVGLPVIDATEEVTAVHQDHDRPRKNSDFYKFEKQRNIELAGGSNFMCSLQDADWILTKEGLKKPPFPRIIFSKLTLFKPWRYLITLKRQIQNYFRMGY